MYKLILMCSFNLTTDLTLIYMQYIPKINGEIPPEEEAISDHERLRNRYLVFVCSIYVFYHMKTILDSIVFSLFQVRDV